MKQPPLFAALSCPELVFVCVCVCADKTDRQELQGQGLRRLYTEQDSPK